jgi:hypothetical protein
MPVIPIVVVIACLLAAVPVLTYFAFSMGRTVFIVALAAIPFVILLINRPKIWFILLAWTFGAQIRLVLGGSLTVFTVLCAGLSAILLAHFVIVKRIHPFGRAVRWWGIAFLTVCAVTMYFRGLGFSFMKGDLIGGMRYVLIMIPLCLLITSGLVTLTAKEWKYTLIGMCIFGMLPSLAEAIFVISDGRIYHLYYLIQPKGAVGKTLFAHVSGEDLVRYKTMTNSSRYLLLLALMAFPGRGRTRPLQVILVLIALVIGGLSGHRQNIIYLLGILLVFGFLRAEGRRAHYLSVCLAVAVAGYVVLFAFARFLPYNIQRAVSWVPGVPVSYAVILSGQGTEKWRIGVWSRALREVPQYFWLGKGFAYSETVYHSLENMDRREAYYEHAILTGGYHNGPLGLIIGLGIFGVITSAGLFLTASTQQGLLACKEWADPVLERYHLAILSMFLARIPSFIIITGNVHIVFPELFYLLVLLHGVTKTDLRLRKDQSLEREPSARQAEPVESPWDRAIPVMHMER